MPYSYVKFNSNDANDFDGLSNFTVNLPRPIENCKSVHVKHFSMPNTSYNIREAYNYLWWYETRGDGALANNPVLLSAIIPPDFYSVPHLCSTISTLMTSASASKFAEGQTVRALTYEVTQIPSSTVENTYHVQIIITDPTGGEQKKKFMPVTYHKSIWAQLGFKETFSNDVFVDPSIGVRSIADHRFTTIDKLVNSTKTVIAEFPPRESHELYHVTSSLASSIVEANGKGKVAKPTNFLLTVPNTAQRYSWLQYTPAEPVFHRLDGVSVSSFTLGLADEHGVIMKNSEHQTFSVVLAIEYEDLHNTLTDHHLRTLEWRKSHC